MLVESTVILWVVHLVGQKELYRAVPRDDEAAVRKVVYSVGMTVACLEQSMVRMEDVTVASSAGQSADC